MPSTPTLTRAQGSPRGIVSGHVLKRLREAAGVTQTTFAELAQVDTTTVQGWESGRRPLTALRVADLVRLRHLLVRLGVAPAAVRLLNDAADADVMLSYAIDAGDLPGDLARHPLGVAVHRRTVTKLITWPLSGVAPPELRTLPGMPRRGPVPDRPVLAARDAERFFDHLRATADAATGRAGLLHRQSVFLLGFDRRPETAVWLRTQPHGTPARVADVDPSAWLAARSSVVALARTGDRDPLAAFIEHGLADDRSTLANLSYWAYWLGELPDDAASDAELLAADPTSWAGTRLLAHLAGHLDDPAHAELNVHSLWALVAARPTLMQQYPTLRATVAERVEHALDVDTDTGSRTNRARTELAGLAYAAKLAER